MRRFQAGYGAPPMRASRRSVVRDNCPPPHQGLRYALALPAADNGEEQT